MRGSSAYPIWPAAPVTATLMGDFIGEDLPRLSNLLRQRHLKMRKPVLPQALLSSDWMF
jgi:hypothetical protein